MSAPLVLGFDLRDTQKMEEVWPIISNTEALRVNEAWAGDAGVLVASSDEEVTFQNCSWFNNDPCKHPAWMVWAKVLPPAPSGAYRVAALLMNNRDEPADVSVDWDTLDLKCPPHGGHVSCYVRDLWKHAAAGWFINGYTARQLPSRDSAFIIVSTLATA